ncbi:hypothetical protein G7Z17_g543 [Cylindrodendrum hubeiense]|uniref:Uncharacterized protein n=1 Tax=Cylindrodendrum hubeiense TaxID=595255 RepID=A0A9P5LKZ2_9HYPO|nr:hypothetical protein G7Z17_g543 [Cylindrodendrum hubeiense]
MTVSNDLSSTDTVQQALDSNPDANTDCSNQRPLEPVGEGFSLVEPAARENPSRASPEPITDLQGHYVGPASGLSFLARVRKSLHSGDHTSSTFTFGDAPLAEYDPTPSVMVSIEDSFKLVQKFFEFTIPIDRILHRPMIEEWLQEFHKTMGSMRNSEYAPARRAIIWIIFAMAQEHMPLDDRATSDDARFVCFT